MLFFTSVSEEMSCGSGLSAGLWEKTAKTSGNSNLKQQIKFEINVLAGH